MISLTNRVIAITGGASGIGLETARLLSSLGAKVSIGDLHPAGLEAVAAEIKKAGGDVITAVIDVRKAETVDAWIKETVEWGGRLDGACNLAGVIGKGIGVMKVEDFDENEWDFIMDVNCKGVMHCMRAELKVMARDGAIVNAASIAGLMGFGANAAYAASKHAVIGLSRSAAKEVGDRAIRVNCIAPSPPPKVVDLLDEELTRASGAIDTPMLRNSFAISGNEAVKSALWPLERQGKPEEVAKLVAFLVSDASSFISGAVYGIDGGWNC